VLKKGNESLLDVNYSLNKLERKDKLNLISAPLLLNYCGLLGISD